MSHQKTAINEERTFSLATCTLPPTPYVPGIQYRFTGLSQGTLGSYDIVTTALSTTELDSNVTVITSTGSAWYGMFDYTTCELTKLIDEFDNNVNGSANITVFPWFDGVSVNGNHVEDISSFIPGGTVIIQNVKIRGGSSLDLSGFNGSIVVDSVELSGASAITLLGSSTVSITSSYFNSSSITASTNSNITVSNVVDNGGIFTIGGTGNHTLTNVASNKATITLNQASNVNVNGVLVNASTINLTNTLTGNFTLGLINSSLLDNSTLTNVAVALAANSTYTSINLQRGTLNVNQFNGTNLMVLNDTTTLAGATSNAKKDGYAGALP